MLSANLHTNRCLLSSPPYSPLRSCHLFQSLKSKKNFHYVKNIPDFVFQFFYNIFSEEIRLFFEVGLRKFEPEISFSGNDAK